MDSDAQSTDDQVSLWYADTESLAMYPGLVISGPPQNFTFSVFEEVNASFTICSQYMIYC